MSVVDDAELVVSELVTNAVKATNAIPPNARYPELYDRLEVICLCLYADGADVLIEIWDPKPDPPAPRRVTLDEEGGRGLWLVASLSRSWGTRHPSTGGKTVWARLGPAPADAHPTDAHPTDAGPTGAGPTDAAPGGPAESDAARAAPAQADPAAEQ